MSNERKWLIEPNQKLTQQQRKKLWERIHCQDGYDQTIFTMMESRAVRQRVLEALQPHSPRDVLVPGCGSRTHMEQDLVQQLPIQQVRATDFKRVVQLAQKRFQHPRVHYEARDSTELPWQKCFDAVVNINAVVSESDRENRQILDRFHQSLRPDGIMVGFFPTVFSIVDMAFLDDPTRLRRVDFQRSSFRSENFSQVFYTPLRLRQVLREVGFTIDRFELFFCDDEHGYHQTRKHHGTRDPDLLWYEHFIVARA